METRNGTKKPRSNRGQIEKLEKEDRDRQRQEAANKRKGRAERRRAEGAYPSSLLDKAGTRTMRRARLICTVQIQIFPKRYPWRLSRRCNRRQRNLQAKRIRPQSPNHLEHPLPAFRQPAVPIKGELEATEGARGGSKIPEIVIRAKSLPHDPCLGIYRKAMKPPRLAIPNPQSTNTSLRKQRHPWRTR